MSKQNMDLTKCDCGHAPTPTTISPGYGIYENKTYCFPCCAENDRRAMESTGKATLYLVNSEVTNWPSSLRFPVFCSRTGKHNIAGKRYDVWFQDRKGTTWYGVTYGGNTQICHCQRTKSK